LKARWWDRLRPTPVSGRLAERRAARGPWNEDPDQRLQLFLEWHPGHLKAAAPSLAGRAAAMIPWPRMNTRPSSAALIASA